MMQAEKGSANVAQTPVSYLVLIVVALVAAYHDTFTWIVKTWFTFTAAHGPVILAISVYMVWANRQEIKAAVVKPALVTGSVVTVLGCLMLLSGTIGSVLLLQYLSVIVTLLGLVLLVWGYAAATLLWSPICYLVFMFPVFNEVLDRFSIFFQLIAAWIAHNLLLLVGIPSIRTAQFIELPSNSLEVARECNGINHMMALLSLAVLLAWWTQRTWKKRAILVASAFPVAIAANGLRVFCIGVLSELHKGGPLHGPFDMFYVSFIFFFGSVVLVGISLLLGRDRQSEAVEESMAAVYHGGGATADRVRFATGMAVSLLTLAAVYLTFLRPVPVSLQAPLGILPCALGEWQGREAVLDELPYRFFSADRELKRVYIDRAGNEIKLYIGYFPVQSQDHEVVNYRFDALQQDSERVDLQAGGQVVTVNQIATRNGETLYSWYDVNGKVLTSRYRSKITSILEGLLRRRTNAAVVVIGVGGGTGSRQENCAIEFVKVAFPLIEAGLSVQ